MPLSRKAAQRPAEAVVEDIIRDSLPELEGDIRRGFALLDDAFDVLGTIGVTEREILTFIEAHWGNTRMEGMPAPRLRDLSDDDESYEQPGDPEDDELGMGQREEPFDAEKLWKGPR